MPNEVFVGKKIYIMYNVGKVLEKQVFTLLVGKIDEHNIMKGVCEYLKKLTKIHKCATPWPAILVGNDQRCAIKDALVCSAQHCI